MPPPLILGSHPGYRTPFVPGLLRLPLAVTVPQTFLGGGDPAVLSAAAQAFCSLSLGWDSSDGFLTSGVKGRAAGNPQSRGSPYPARRGHAHARGVTTSTSTSAVRPQVVFARLRHRAVSLSRLLSTLCSGRAAPLREWSIRLYLLKREWPKK